MLQRMQGMPADIAAMSSVMKGLCPYGIKPAWFASTAKAKTDTRPYTNAVLRLDSTGCVSMYAAPIAVASNVFPSIRFEVVAHATKFAPSLPAPAGALNHFTQSS
mmetsp:Transcript_50120/g.154216  ORF Transcript_50120/g.154216 Transcript_50120/m.154216 type:complete len:105 (-) Transcript_50120:150-464(-)